MVRGVVLEVEEAALAITDHIEGFIPGRGRNVYVREQVSVHLDGGESLRAWTYFYVAAHLITDRPKLIVGEEHGKSIFAWDPSDQELLPKHGPNGSNS